MEKEKFTNALIKEKSPYLLQHAHNPVNWVAWNKDSLQKAKHENKLIIISVGYSACHWCHVMEHESFQDEYIATIMNENFISIKVDREERPDIDQVYMSAVQIMTGHGGWPLNCIALPDGRPLYGGTYFPKKDWANILFNLANIWKSNPSKAEEYADELTQGIKHLERQELNEQDKNFSIEILNQAVIKWEQSFDYEKGGTKRAPKFPMPNNWLFLMRYSRMTDNIKLESFVNTTLLSMANGGIYDQAGGGFARYSTDMDWKVPHFEKMLYDNAQLISLYAEAYRAYKKDLYKDVAEETIRFIENELSFTTGGFFSALDADSEGEEGKFYVWEKIELEKIIGKEDFEIFTSVFSINETGYWEDEKYILLISEPLQLIASRYNITIDTLSEKVAGWKTLLLDIRNKRTRPGLDDKILASWNAMMIKAYCDAYNSFGKNIYKEKALSSLKFFISAFENKNGGLFHSRKNNQSYINGFLEDYAFAIDAAINVYLIDAGPEYIDLAVSLMNFALDKFYDEVSGMFYFTSSDDDALIVRKFEIMDNVIPSSNSVMAGNLYSLFQLTGNNYYKKCAEKMLNNVIHEISPYISAYSNWGILLMKIISNSIEVVLCGTKSEQKYLELLQNYRPNILVGYSESENFSPFFKNRFQLNKSLIYVCRNQSCNAPAEAVSEAIQLIDE
ncbi:MAG: thioredoxin domain-containing protein [Bacteroidota bacterium]|jgi:uncharacterized protein YyaL (SSP411 family)